jgi:hypothetical protein
MQVTVRNAVTVTCAAAVLVLGVDYASFATTGDSLILGRSTIRGQRPRWSNMGLVRRCDWRREARRPRRWR